MRPSRREFLWEKSRLRLRVRRHDSSEYGDVVLSWRGRRAEIHLEGRDAWVLPELRDVLAFLASTPGASAKNVIEAATRFGIRDAEEKA